MISAAEIVDALRLAQSRGVRGGCVYDYMHLLAAKKGNAPVLYTLNISDFQHLRRSEDPEIRLP